MTEPVEPIADVDASRLIAWIGAIDFADWPQQTRLADGQLRPAMVNDPYWHGFAEEAEELTLDVVAHLVFDDPLGRALEGTDPMLSVVMPGHAIEPHVDARQPDHLLRVHVPLVTNPGAQFIAAGRPYSLEAGRAYRVDPAVEHAIVNSGPTPRIHFIFDVRVRR